MGLLDNVLTGSASGALSAIGNIAGIIGQNKAIDKQIQAQKEENQRNREYNLMLARQQNEWNIEQWSRENAYNAPAAVRARLAAGGVNPDLFYGNSGISQAASSPTMTSGAPSSPVDMSALGQKQSVVAALAKSSELAYQKALTDNVQADTEKKRSETTGQNISNYWQSLLNDNTLKLGNSQIQLYQSNVKLNDAQVRQIDANIGLIKANVEKIEDERALFQSQATLNKIDATLREPQVQAQILALKASAHLSYTEASDIVYTLGARLAGLNADAARSQRAAELLEKQGVLVDVTADGLDFKLGQDKKFDSAQRVFGMIGDALGAVGSLVTGVIGGGIAAAAKLGKPVTVRGFGRR